ncbi:hypothetical protein CC85DRAFT_316205 [Cutaneotrichosporon oleaginosum]|uniref:RFX-type winged-helix domain-containing protein n=1 Tax=Cutaneotrichosporon oleaginosum TaxID=879819 RepID=A0A0J0XBC6_9TREE|nr:uncharacterized protein CC85DRAFT_316205 [Cutaneotrichosporon oleaginosum]KLT38355.1 hypothetical protein CC85DRAFT_316205 [Cutaneotrichosporon oleaginosum]TXT03991.1 hypothetical protein COLE_07688 [Cutaneotrichosporon oleaginosum]
MALTPNIGLGVGIGLPPTPMSATLQPALMGRSPVGPPSMIMPNQGYPPTMGKSPHDRRNVPRPSPYHLQSSRSTSLSLKSEDEDFMLYAAPGQPSYPSPWPGGMIGDMNQMTLEQHRRLDFLEQDLDLGGPAAERETAIRADLANKAEQVRALSPCQHVNGFTVPRQGLYHSYTMSCNDFGLRPINSASFGKVVRSTFLGIRTRRLGVRGNSKYHYVSLRPAISTEAHRLNAYGDSSGQLHIAPQDGDFSMEDHGGDIMTEDDTEEEEDDDLAELSEGMTYSAHPFPHVQPSGPGGRSRSGSQDEHLVIRSARPAHMPHYVTPTVSGVSSGASTAVRLSSPGAPRPAPPFPALSAGVDSATAAFWQSFCAAQEQLGRFVTELDLDSFQQNYRNFWESQSPETLQLCSQPPLASMLVDGMAMSYDHIILSLVDKILAPIPPNAHAALGMMAVNFDKMTADILGGLATEVSRPIIELSSQVGQLFARFLDLHQITTAIGPILAEPEQLSNMRNSWRMLDTNFVIRQCMMACDCSEELLEPALAAFGNWLHEVGANMAAYPVEQLAMCVDGAVGQAEGLLMGSNIRAIIPKASYLTSQVMRLLTLRSDVSFGWFQLIKTWIDDYVTISCMRRAAFARPSPNLLGSGTLQPKDLQSHHNPPLAIDTASATYSTVALDQSAITPRPAFTASGAATQATGPGVGGIAGTSITGMAGAAGGPSTFM